MCLTSIVIKDTIVKKYILHNNEYSFESLLIELKDNLIPCYLKNYKTFTVDTLFNYIINYSSLYDADCGINEDSNNLCVIDITSPSQIMFTCYDVYTSFDYTTGYNCEIIYQKAINISGLESVLVDIGTECDDDVQPDEIVVDDTVTLIDDASDTLFYIKDRNDFIKKIVESNYKKNMSKNEFISLLKDIYDIIVSKTKLNI